MTKSAITSKIKEEVSKKFEKFNKTEMAIFNGEIEYFAEFKGKYLYLKRKEYDNVSEIARLTYTGKIENWDFAIYRYSSEQYDPDVCFFPGKDEIDGTIEGAMKAGLKAYPL